MSASNPSIHPDALTTISSPDGASTGVLQAIPGSRSAFHRFSPVAGSTARRYEYVRRASMTTAAGPVSSTEFPTPWLPPTVPYSAPSFRRQTVSPSWVSAMKSPAVEERIDALGVHRRGRRALRHVVVPLEGLGGFEGPPPAFRAVGKADRG